MKKHGKIYCSYDVYNPEKWTLEKDFKYSGITIPAGYRWDGASVPRIVQNIIPAWGRYAMAALVHDYLIDNKIGTRVRADSIFYRIMIADGVPKWKAKLMYACVKFQTKYITKNSF